jgi:SagB-type dehydrogenase family enzyme
MPIARTSSPRIAEYEDQMFFSKDRREILTHFSHWMIAFWLAPSFPSRLGTTKGNSMHERGMMKLPGPKTEGVLSVEQAIGQRRTIRSFSQRTLHRDQLSQLLWAAQGITGVTGFKRAAPSAGALYPMDIYTVLGPECVTRMEAGVYHFEPGDHSLSLISRRDTRDAVARACLSQMWMAEAPLHLIITAEYRRITGKYGNRGVRYAMIESGHIGQNIFLQAEALGLKSGIVGAYHDEKLVEILNLPRTHEPLLVMPVGYAA